MASIINDGPKRWLIDVVDRKLGRLAWLGAGCALISVWFALHPPRPRTAPLPDHTRPLTTDDLAEVEAHVLDLRDLTARHMQATREQVTRIAAQLVD